MMISGTFGRGSRNHLNTNGTVVKLCTIFLQFCKYSARETRFNNEAELTDNWHVVVNTVVVFDCF